MVKTVRKIFYIMMAVCGIAGVSIPLCAQEPQDMAPVSAEAESGEDTEGALATAMTKEDLNIVFAVDHSGSMNKQDARRMIPQMLKVFADTMHGEKIRIGYVAYNDTILTRMSPVSVQQVNRRELFKESVEGVENRGETDIGLGLREAYHLMDGCTGKKMVVLISDGETDLERSDTGRTEKDSERDVEEIIRICREEGTPVVTVAFGEEYEGEQEELKRISSRTGGESYTAKVPEELVGILYDLFHTNFSYAVREAGDSIYGEGKQRLNIETGGIRYDELTVLLLSDREIKSADIAHGTKEVELCLMGNYAVAGLLDAKDDLSVRFETEQEQRMAVFLIGRRNVIPVVEWEGSIYKNTETQFRVYFTDGEGKRLEETAYYGEFPWRATFLDSSGTEIALVDLVGTQTGLEGAVKFEHSGIYGLALETGRNSENTYEVSGINVLNTLPDSRKSERLELLTVSGEQTVNLEDYFKDADGDALGFALQDLPDQVVSASVEGHFLHVVPKGKGEGDIVLLVSDGEGSLMGHIPVRVRYWVEVYWEVPLLLLGILLFAVIKVCRNRKRVVVVPDVEKEKRSCYFTGKLNAYFTLLPEGVDEIPPLTFGLHHIREGKIVIGDMFKGYPELSGLLELEHMVLYPAENRKIILYHNSKAAVMIGNSIVCRKMQYAVGYGSVIYVTSADGSCELEIHYISMV